MAEQDNAENLRSWAELWDGRGGAPVYRAEHEEMAKELRAAAAEIESLRVERERLREALRRIKAKFIEGHQPAELWQIARAALSGAGTAEPQPRAT